jgi:ABC-type Mn2+/Zn2+ transport system permease subunit
MKFRFPLGLMALLGVGFWIGVVPLWLAIVGGIGCAIWANSLRDKTAGKEEARLGPFAPGNVAVALALAIIAGVFFLLFTGKEGISYVDGTKKDIVNIFQRNTH